MTPPPVASRPAPVRSSALPRRWLARGIVLSLLAVLPGCTKWLLFGGLLLGGPPSIEPDFDRETRQSMTDKDVTVAVVCYAPTEVRYLFSNIDRDLEKYVANRMFLKKIQVLNPDRVRDWLDRNPDWDTPDEIGAAFNATYVVYIDLSHFTLYEKNSNGELYRGRADALTTVWEMDADGTGEPIFSKELTSVYPLGMARSTYDTKYLAFKREYLERLSEEIGRLFYEHYNGDDITDIN